MGFVYDSYSKKAAADQIKILHDAWVKIYQKIGLADIDGEEIVRFSATLMKEYSGDKPLSAEESRDYFLSCCQHDKKKVIEIVRFISSVTDQLKDIYLNRRQKAVTKIAQARLLAVSIKLSRFTQEQKNNLLERWERVTFRIFGIYGNDARTAVGKYVRLSKMLMTRKVSYRKICEEIVEIGAEFPISRAGEMLAKQDCYTDWSEQLRYFFFRYEEDLAGKNMTISNEVWSQIWKESPLKSIEHIYPQKEGQNIDGWKGKLGRSKKSIAKQVHRLGNLLLLPPNVNGQCSNKPFSKKKEIYKRQLLRLKDEIVTKNDWNLKALEARERKLIKWAKQTWCDL
jgi:hypothetical protein